MVSIINRIKQIIKVKLWSRGQRKSNSHSDFPWGGIIVFGFMAILGLIALIITISAISNAIGIDTTPIATPIPTPQPTPIPNIDEEISSKIATMLQFLPLILIVTNPTALAGREAAPALADALVVMPSRVTPPLT